ncbi:L,D-transpeptidase [Streptomyces sp. NPDC015661]|uniref:L,D-transpeptidase n=1 Tax=Streptomyces sp. NPDC015661 TaxID=3364961 RepID=UPI0036FD8520
MLRSRTRALALASTVLALALAAPAGTAANAAATAPRARAAGGQVTLVFDKNPKNPTYSKLTAYLGKRVVGQWRAGSGTTTNPCQVGKGRSGGWLPNGTYAIPFRTKTHNGKAIKGYAIRLADKKCKGGKGANRDELFIHSRMTVNGASQWRGDRDYKSLGCVKLHPDHIKALFKTLDKYGEARTLKVVA